MKICPQCRSQFTDDVVMCSVCRTPLPAGMPFPGAVSQPQAQLWLWLSFFLLYCCCAPIGIPAIIFAIRAVCCEQRQDFVGMTQNLKTTKILFFIGLGLGVASWFLNLLIQIFAS